MKTIQRITFCSLSVLIIELAACTSISSSESIVIEDQDCTHSLLLEKSTAPITAEQAINVVKLFDLENHIVTKSNTAAISDVYTHFNQEGALYSMPSIVVRITVIS